MKYESDILEAIHENAVSNFKIGAISTERMREYDEMCLVNEPEEAYGEIPYKQAHAAMLGATTQEITQRR